MGHRTLVGAGAIGTIVAAICCATPVLAVVLPLLGLGAWLGVADYVLIPLLLSSLALVGLGLYRRRTAARACCETETSKGGLVS
jgi:mercuric ion transport protein